MTTDPASTKSWELSLYELHRTPQEAVTDNTEIAVSSRCLHNELMCPICLELLKCTMTTKECLHRFCQECIITALRSGNKECPTCRKKLVSKRSLRPDPNFDDLIAKIYPSRDEYEAQQEKVLATLSKNCSQAALVSSIEEGMKMQAQSKPQRSRKANQRENAEDGGPNSLNATPNPSAPPSPRADSNPAPLPGSAQKKRAKIQSENESCSNSESSYADGGAETESSIRPEKEYDLELKPHPDERIKEVKYIKAPGNATVEHISRYLSMRGTLDWGFADVADGPGGSRAGHFAIYIPLASGGHSLLSASWPLREVHERHWRQLKPMELYFLWKKSP